MRPRCSVFIATSLDGFIAREDGALDWLPQEPNGESYGYEEFMATVDALVIGRKTFQTVLSFDAWPYGEKQVVVLSDDARVESLIPAGARCEQMAGDPTSIAERLGARGFRHLYVDGGTTIQRFLASDLIDDLTITRVPLLLGGGIPLFGALDGDLRFTHVATRSFASGLVQSEYTRRR